MRKDSCDFYLTQLGVIISMFTFLGIGGVFKLKDGSFEQFHCSFCFCCVCYIVMLNIAHVSFTLTIVVHVATFITSTPLVASSFVLTVDNLKQSSMTSYIFMHLEFAMECSQQFCKTSCCVTMNLKTYNVFLCLFWLNQNAWFSKQDERKERHLCNLIGTS